MKTKRVEVELYVANDGMEFKTQGECERHEAEIANAERNRLRQIRQTRDKLLRRIHDFKHPYWIGSGYGRSNGKFFDAENELRIATEEVRKERKIRRKRADKLYIFAPMLMRMCEARKNLAHLKETYKGLREELKRINSALREA